MIDHSVISTSQSEGFVETPAVKKIVNRALGYLQAGFAVHLCGPTGTGKTTLAMHLANLMDQPVMLMYGDEEFKTSDLVGDKLGYSKRKLIDNFIHSVLKTEEDVMQRWVNNRLTTAVKEGFTLIYDEFNRSRPEANNALLSVLEEGILSLPTSEEEGGYIKAHPNFRAIFTSNPEEYAGVHKTQDALLDRMVTMHVDYFDEPTETKIIQNRTGIALEDAERIIALIRGFRNTNGIRKVTTIRPGIVIGSILKQKGITADYKNPFFREICLDALSVIRATQEELDLARETICRLIDEHCGGKPFSTSTNGQSSQPQPEADQSRAGTQKDLQPRDNKGRFINLFLKGGER
ncbi:gas vesicle protein GvpN [Patescibacteria group bacterium]|nr:gas vesicle protein GvpN [Patescibacteria group bacterium]MBU4016234.1 gas vesicle protein GvpN [Patescibacteria group bacterium]MBU4099307.1 gas vesicle protein GvpN [Patescibacteria group bacterium]